MCRTRRSTAPARSLVARRWQELVERLKEGDEADQIVSTKGLVVLSLSDGAHGTDTSVAEPRLEFALGHHTDGEALEQEALEVEAIGSSRAMIAR